MRLAIADPPYPPNLLAAGRGGGQTRASRWYGQEDPRSGAAHYTTADLHPDAAEWDDPARHRRLLTELHDTYDGWAIATAWDAVPAVYAPLPVGCRVMVWVRPNAIPTGHRIRSMYEAVIVYPPAERMSAIGKVTVPDVLIEPAPARGFAGAKPPRWTRWVLDALGYDPSSDTVDDLFPGSGAVTDEVAQGVLL